MLVDAQRGANGLVLTGLLVFILCNVVYDHFGGWGDIWYIGQSFAFVCYAGALYALNKNRVTEILLVATGGQLADELLGDPSTPDPLEYYVFGAYALYLLVGYLFKKYEGRIDS